MALSKLQIDYMQTQGSFSVGASLMPSTPRWTQETPDDPAVRLVFALSQPELNTLAADLGLYEVGWRTSSTDFVALFMSSTGTVASGYQHILPRTAIDFVRVNPIVTGQGLLAEAIAQGSKRASSDALLALVEGLLDLIGSRRFHEIDDLLQTADPAQLAPEVSVGILRVTSNYNQWLRHWSALLAKTQEEFRRRGLSPDQILVGLIGG
jgi:hypothetical protein